MMRCSLHLSRHRGAARRRAAGEDARQDRAARRVRSPDREPGAATDKRLRPAEPASPERRILIRRPCDITSSRLNAETVQPGHGRARHGTAKAVDGDLHHALPGYLERPARRWHWCEFAEFRNNNGRRSFATTAKAVRCQPPGTGETRTRDEITARVVAVKYPQATGARRRSGHAPTGSQRPEPGQISLKRCGISHRLKFPSTAETWPKGIAPRAAGRLLGMSGSRVERSSAGAGEVQESRPPGMPPRQEASLLRTGRPGKRSRRSSPVAFGSELCGMRDRFTTG